MQAVATAALTFDVTRGAKLSTFMYNQIRFSMWKALQEETHTVHLSPYYLSIWKKIDNAAKECGRLYPFPPPPFLHPSVLYFNFLTQLAVCGESRWVRTILFSRD